MCMLRSYQLFKRRHEPPAAGERRMRKLIVSTPEWQSPEEREALVRPTT